MSQYNIIYLTETDSTNDEVKRLAVRGYPEGTVAAAERQTAGKGRTGKSWDSSAGGLFFSILLKPNEVNPGRLTLTAGIAVTEAVRSLGIDAGLKWPNDVLHQGKKLCGILAETSYDGQGTGAAALGIGVNVNNPAFQGTLSETASSLKIITGNEFDKKDVLERVLASFFRYYKMDWEGVISRYKELCLNIGNAVILTKAVSGEQISGIAIDVDPSGGLAVRLASGEVKIVNSGEVSFRPPVFNIGNVGIAGRVFAAPMAGVTDGVYRAILAAQGAAVTYTEMVSAKGLTYGGEGSFRLLDNFAPGKTAAVQLFGGDPEDIAKAARLLNRYPDYQIIDINCGCPATKVTKNTEGAALMKDPARIGRIVGAVAKATKKPVTVKLRKGYGRNDNTAVQAAVAAWENGASAVCVHGRTREQMYSGTADWEVIKAVKEVVGIPVIGNGDADSPEAVKRMIETTGCDAVMIGRGMWGNPWLIGRAKAYLDIGIIPPEPDIGVKVREALSHMNELAKVKGEKAAVREMRRHIHMYLKGSKGASGARLKINTAETAGEVTEILFEFANLV